MYISFIFLTCVFNNNDDDMSPPHHKADSEQKNANTDQEFFFTLKPESAFLGWPWVNPHHQNFAVLSTSFLRIFPLVNTELFTQKNFLSLYLELQPQ